MMTVTVTVVALRELSLRCEALWRVVATIDADPGFDASVQKCDVLAVNNNRMMGRIGLWLSS
jgi:hypothetical protein